MKLETPTLEPVVPPKASGESMPNVRRQGQIPVARMDKSSGSLPAAWLRQVESRSGVFADRDLRRAALNLMEDAEHARRAEQRAAEGRQRAEGAMRASQTKYQNLFDSIDEGFCITEVLFIDGQPRDCRFLEVNPAFEKQTGFQNATGRTIRDLGGAEDNQWFEACGKIALTGETARFEHAAPTGAFYDVYAFRIDEPEKRLVAVLFNDVTERKRQESNSAFLAEIAGDMASLSSVAEIMRTVGAKIGPRFDAPGCHFAEAEAGKGCVSTHHGWGHDGMMRLLKILRMSDCLGPEFLKAAQAGEIFVVNDTTRSTGVNAAACAEFQVGAFIAMPCHRDGEWNCFLALTDMLPRVWKNEEIELFSELALRVFPCIERARTEEALRKSETRNRIALDAAAMAAWDYDVPAHSVEWNDQHDHLFGLEPDGLPKKPEEFLQFVHPEDLPAVRTALVQAVEETGVYRADFRIIRNDGVIRWMSGFGRAMETVDGRAVRMGGVMFDITDRHAADEALAAALRQTRAAQEEAEAASQGPLSGRAFP